MEVLLTLPLRKVSLVSARTETETASLVWINSQLHLCIKAAHKRLRLWISSQLAIRQPLVFHKVTWYEIHTSLRNTLEVQTALKRASNSNNYHFTRQQLASRTRLTAPSLINKSIWLESLILRAPEGGNWFQSRRLRTALSEESSWIVEAACKVALAWFQKLPMPSIKVVLITFNSETCQVLDQGS